MTDQAAVKLNIGKWSICEDAQGEFYWDTELSQSYNEPPPELQQLYASHFPGEPPLGTQPLMAQPGDGQAQQMDVMVGDDQTRVLDNVGKWAVCEDKQGVFYYNRLTRESQDETPPEVAEHLARKGSPGPIMENGIVHEQPPMVASYSPPPINQSYQPTNQYQKASYQPQMSYQPPRVLPAYSQPKYGGYGPGPSPKAVQSYAPPTQGGSMRVAAPGQPVGLGVPMSNPSLSHPQPLYMQGARPPMMMGGAPQGHMMAHMPYMGQMTAPVLPGQGRPSMGLLGPQMASTAMLGRPF